MGNTEAAIASEFNSWLNEYTEKMVRIVPFYFQLMEDLRTLLPDEFNPNKVVDLGAGNGNLTAQLIKWFPQSNHTLIDASKEMLDEACKRFPNTTLSTKSQLIQDINFGEQQVDLFAASFSLHHLPQSDKKLVFDKMHRSLRPGGYFIYSDLMVDKDGSEHPALLSYWKDFVLRNASEGEWQDLMEHYDQYDYPASEAEQVQWLMDVGFTSVQVVRNDTHWIALAASY